MLRLLNFEIRSRLGGIAGWGLGVGSYALMYMTLYPSISEQFGGLDLSQIEFYQAFGAMSMTTFPGYTVSTIVNFIPILLGIFAIIAGTGVLAGEEEDGTLELIAAGPLWRWQIVMAKWLGLAAAAAGVVLIVVLAALSGLAYVSTQIETGVSAADLIPVLLNSLPITLFFMTFSMFLGAYLPRRKFASGVATVFFIFSYFANNLAASVKALEPLTPFLPFHYYDASLDVLAEGPQIENVLVLLAAVLVCLLLTLLSFQRRNLTVGAWPWQRARIP